MDASARARAHIIVVNWNGREDTLSCLESLGKLEGGPYKIIIVDNGSTDGSAKAIRIRFPDVSILEAGRNLGFAGGVNLGLRRAISDGASRLILLNNDTIVDKGFATELLKAADVTGAGIICSKVYFYDRSDVIWYAGAWFCNLLGYGRHRGFGQKDTGQFDRVEETPRPSACAMLVTAELCDKIGLMDERYFCYCEDMDWGMRARKAGFKVVYAPGSRVWHKVSASSGGVSTGRSLYYSTRNTLYCLDKNSPLPLPLKQLRWLSVAIFALMSIATMGVSLSGAHYVLKGFGDYINGRFGELAQ